MPNSTDSLNIAGFNISKLYIRYALFLIGCMGTRAYLTYLAKTASSQTLKYMGYIAIIPAIGFMYIYMTDSRTTGAETFGDKIWWNNLRPIHAFLYAGFAYLAITGSPNAWLLLAVDVVLGLCAFLYHHFL